MNRTGIEQSRTDRVVTLVRVIADAGWSSGACNYYDGQYGGLAGSE